MTDDPRALARRLVAGERRALSKAITLIESDAADDRGRAEELLAALLPETGRAVRLGVSGPPGVGKSTFIEALGLHVIEQGHRIAVLAVDPSSAVSGGSILGDKTRMERLARAPEGFIRPSPSGRQLGGVARRTREAMLACEAAGFDVVIVETVGVGQNETAVADMVDTFLLLIAPGGGDELQGIKRGVMELADIALVNKADGALKVQAERTCADYRSALRLLSRHGEGWTTRIETCSALKGEGIGAAWELVAAHRASLEGSGALARRRAAQAVSWMWSEVREGLMAGIKKNPAVAALAEELEAGVGRGDVPPGLAARRILDALRTPPGKAAASAGGAGKA